MPALRLRGIIIVSQQSYYYVSLTWTLLLLPEPPQAPSLLFFNLHLHLITLPLLSILNKYLPDTFTLLTSSPPRHSSPKPVAVALASSAFYFVTQHTTGVEFTIAALGHADRQPTPISL